MNLKSKIIRIGNSKGIRLPKPILEQAGIVEDVELMVEKGQITIQAVTEIRHGWDAAFKEMANHGDDALLDDALLDVVEAPMAEDAEWPETEWDKTEWIWE